MGKVHGRGWALRERKPQDPGRKERCRKRARETGEQPKCGEGPGDEGEGGAGVKAPPKRESTRSGPGREGVEVVSRSPRTSARPRLPGDPAARGGPSPHRGPARPFRAALTSATAASGWAPRLVTGSCRGARATAARVGWRGAPGRHRWAGSAGTSGGSPGQATGLGGLTPSAPRMRERPGPRLLLDGRS